MTANKVKNDQEYIRNESELSEIDRKCIENISEIDQKYIGKIPEIN